MGCHGNHAFSHSLNKFNFEDNFFRMYGVPMNNLAPIEIVLGAEVQLRSNKLPVYNFKSMYFHIYKQITTQLSPFVYPLGPKLGPKIRRPLKVCIMKYTLM